MERVDVRGLVMNRTKALVLALFAVYWIIIVTILAVARNFYDSQLTVNCLKR
jgi:sensor domain CHASE-containing protein